MPFVPAVCNRVIIGMYVVELAHMWCVCSAKFEI